MASTSGYITTMIAWTVCPNSINIEQEQTHQKLWHHKHRNHLLESYDVLHYTEIVANWTSCSELQITHRIISSTV